MNTISKVVTMATLSLAEALHYSPEQTLRECTIRELMIHIASMPEPEEVVQDDYDDNVQAFMACLLYTSPSPRD